MGPGEPVAGDRAQVAHVTGETEEGKREPEDLASVAPPPPLDEPLDDERECQEEAGDPDESRGGTKNARERPPLPAGGQPRRQRQREEQGLRVDGEEKDGVRRQDQVERRTGT